MHVVCAVVLGFLLWIPAQGQSDDPAFPTPITTNEISGVIPARDIGDPRLTTYYFIFNGNRGDVFLNIVTNNFNGQIDVFTAQGQNPRTKVTIYADNPERETGRVIYQRQPEQLIVRIQGRTPNDDPASYQLKFAGSFAPITGAAAENTNEFPELRPRPDSDARVNSVGTLLPKKPEPAVDEVPQTPDPVRAEGDEAAAPRPGEEIAAAEETDEPAELDTPTEDPPAEKERAPAPVSKPVVVITDDLKPEPEKAREVTVDVKERSADDVSAIVTVERAPDEVIENAEPEVPESRESAKKPEEQPVNPLSRVFLKVEMKDGSRFERKMTEVASVNVVNGMLTIVFIDGTTREIDILSVLKMTIE